MPREDTRRTKFPYDARARRATVRIVVALSATLLLCAACNRSGEPRNVLLISVDSLRADRLGVYGSGRETSPNLDRLARAGVLFERAISPTSWTLPSHVTLLSGLLPHHHGTIAKTDAIASEVALLQESFARAGYETMGLYSGPFLHPFFGFARGFASYRSCESRPSDDPAAGMLRSHRDHTNAAVRDTFVRWLEGRTERPFFAFVHMWDVHFDYIAPEPWGSMFDPGYAGALDGRGIATRKGFPRDASPRDVAHLLALYDGEVRYTDETIGQMLAALERAGVLDDTLVVVTSDHGEEFREHGGQTHHRTVYTESVHVPLLFWAAAGLPQGLRVPTFVSLADVAPTILELVGLPALAGIDGRSLAPALSGATLPAQPVLSALFLPDEAWRRTLAIRSGDESHVLWKKRDAWLRFDVARDPGELRPGASSVAGRAALERYDAEVMALLATREQAAAAAAASAATAGAAAAPDRTLPSDVEARLRELGYLQ